MPSVAGVSGSRQTRISLRDNSVAQPVGGMEARDTPHLPLGPAPAGDVEAEHAQLERGVAAELAQAQHADAALGGVGLRALAPDALALLREIGGFLAV